MRSLKRYSFTYLKQLHCTLYIWNNYPQRVVMIRTTALRSNGYYTEINIYFKNNCLTVVFLNSCFIIQLLQQFCVLTTQWVHGNWKKKMYCSCSSSTYFHDQLIKNVGGKKLSLSTVSDSWCLSNLLDLSLITCTLLLLRLKHKQLLNRTTCITPSAPKSKHPNRAEPCLSEHFCITLVCCTLDQSLSGLQWTNLTIFN